MTKDLDRVTGDLVLFPDAETRFALASALAKVVVPIERVDQSVFP